MTNYEKYKDEIKSAIKNYALYTYLYEKVPRMEDADTDFLTFVKVFTWLMDEYKEPKIDWSKVEVDTKILVTDNRTDHEDNKGYKRHFAKYEDGVVFAFADGATSFSSNGKYISWKYAKLYEGE